MKQVKKILSMTLAIAMLTTLFTVSTSAANVTDDAPYAVDFIREDGASYWLLSDGTYLRPNTVDGSGVPKNLDYLVRSMNNGDAAVFLTNHEMVVTGRKPLTPDKGSFAYQLLDALGLLDANGEAVVISNYEEYRVALQKIVNETESAMLAERRKTSKATLDSGFTNEHEIALAKQVGTQVQPKYATLHAAPATPYTKNPGQFTRVLTTSNTYNANGYVYGTYQYSGDITKPALDGPIINVKDYATEAEYNAAVIDALDNGTNPYKNQNTTVATQTPKPSTNTATNTTAESIPATGTAYAATQSITIDGKKVEFQAYALKDANGNATNYVKLRDIAHALNNTGAQFSVGYKNGAIIVTTEAFYIPSGSEMTTPFSGNRAYQGGTQTLKLNGKDVSLTAITLTDDNGGGYNYFKLRDLGSILGFDVGYSNATGITISTK